MHQPQANGRRDTAAEKTMTLRKLIFALLLLFAGSAQAQLSIEITGAGANQIPVAVSRFAGEDALAQSISDVIEGDLQRSGRFKMLYAGNVSPLPSEINQVSFADWKNRNADALVIGAVSRLPDGRFEVRFRLLDVPKQAQLGGGGLCHDRGAGAHHRPSHR